MEKRPKRKRRRSTTGQPGTAKEPLAQQGQAGRGAVGAQQRPGNRMRPCDPRSPSSPVGMDIQAALGQRAGQVAGSQPGPHPSSTGRATAPGSATARPLPGSCPCRIHLYDRNIAKSKIKLKSKHLKLHHSRKRASSLFFFFLQFK